MDIGGGKPLIVDGIGGLAAMERLLATLAVERDEITLIADLVAEKLPEISVGVAPASDIVGVVGRPCAFELALLMELVLAAGGTDERALD
jgi:hypothetical protein